MIVKIIKRCLLAAVLATTLVFVVVGSCVALACSAPGFYTAAVAQPIEQADAEAAFDEIELTMGALELFLLAGPENLERLGDLPADQLDRGLQWTTEESLPEIRALLDRSVDAERGTFAASLTEEHLRAWASQKMNQPGKEIQRPCLVLDGDQARLGATLVTPLGEFVLSCDIQPVKTAQSDLTFEVHALRLGRLPLPATTLAKLLMDAGAKLPKGVRLDLDGRRPMFTVDATRSGAALELEELRITNGELKIEVRRAHDAVVAAR